MNITQVIKISGYDTVMVLQLMAMLTANIYLYSEHRSAS
jgi:hypothetical protein